MLDTNSEVQYSLPSKIQPHWYNNVLDAKSACSCLQITKKLCLKSITTPAMEEAHPLPDSMIDPLMEGVQPLLAIHFLYPDT